MGNRKEPLVVIIQRFLDKNWKFRYNEVLGRIEFCFKEKDEYRLMNEYDFNSIINHILECGYVYSTSGLKKLLESKFVPKHNPFTHYLNKLEEWDGETDYIDQLASTISTTNDDFWHIALKKWIVAMIGSLLVDNVVNHSFLVFSGGQGIGKTSWLNKLIPAELNNYYFTGAINPNNKDSQIQLAENMIINIDELQGLRSADMEAMKALVTAKEIKIRRPYAVMHETLPHRASFVGSVNSPQFLSDVTGNRRFLCFEVKSIQFEHDVPMDKVFAQAVHLFRNGFQYWFTKDDVEFLNKNNENFRIRNLEEDLLLKHYEPCSEDDEQRVFMTTTEIMNTLAKSAGINFDGRNTYRLGKVLSSCGFIRAKKRNVYGYYLKPIIANFIGYGYGEEPMKGVLDMNSFAKN